MREIKFRVWDKINKIFVTNMTSKSTTCLNYNTGYLVAWNNYELSQYTGLKDKNGKDIYEGDIVRIIEDRGDYVYSDLFNLDHAVEYREGCFFPICEAPSDEFEVIGNKYENPELSDA